MKKILLLLSLLYFYTTSYCQYRSGPGIQAGRLFVPLYQHKTDAPSTANPPILVCVADSVGSTTVIGGYYTIDSLGQHPFTFGSGGGGGGGGMVIGNSVGGGTVGSILFVDPSNNLGQNNDAFFWDSTNHAMGIGTNVPVADLHIFHNESGSKQPGAMFQRNVGSSAAGHTYLYKSRGTFSSPAGPNANDSDWIIAFQAYNGTVPQTVAAIYTRVTGTPSTSNLPGEIGFQTNAVGTPSLLTTAALIDNTQTFNIGHLVAGSAATINDPNKGTSFAEIFGTDPNLGYAAHLILNDNTGVAAGNGAKLMFGTEFSSNSWTGGGYIKGYKANATSGDYGAGISFFSRTNGSLQSEVFRINEQQHMLIGMTSDSTTGVLQVNGASWFSDSIDLKNVRTGTTSDSVAVLHQLSPGKFVLHRVAQSSIGGGGGVTTVGTFSGSSQTNGASISTSTITFGPADATNPGMIVASGSQTLGANLTMPAPKLTGLASAGTSDSVLMWNPSTNQVEYKTGTFNLFAANGLTAAGGDSVYLGGALNQNTNLNLGGNNLTIQGGTSTGTGLYLSSSLYYGINAFSASFSVGDGNNTYVLNSPSSALTITMPTAGSEGGRILYFYSAGAGAGSWSFPSSTVYYLDNSTTVTTLSSNTFYTIESLGSKWFVIGQMSQAQAIRYSHTIFTPTTGGTVALVNNQYNIINPSGSLAALTVNLPSSPANNDVVYIKFTQSVTLVTYGNGTVVDGISAPVAGGLVVLTYDAANSSWY